MSAEQENRYLEFEKNDSLKIGVIGTGILGPSIAQVFSQCDRVKTVYLCKGRDSSRSDGMESIVRSFSKLVLKGKMTQEQVDSFLSKIITGTKEITADADLIVEAVTENLDIKRTVFGELDAICKQDTIFATNTSSLPIKQIGEGLVQHKINTCSNWIFCAIL